VVFYNKASPLHWQKPADLKGKRLGAVTGYSYGFVTPVDGYQLNYVSDPVSNFRKLAAGRLDGVLEELQVGEMLIHNIGAQSRLAYDSKPVKDNPFFLMAGKNNPRAKEVLEVFNQGLALLRSNGRYDTLLEISSQGNSE
jgi:polar amino acid transport system substrate-binding protein